MGPSLKRALVVVSVVAISACAGDDSADRLDDAPTGPPSPLAYDDEHVPTAELMELFGPRVEALGLSLTRAGVHDGDRGPHLALYVEPTGSYTPEEYVETLVPLVAATGPLAMETYPWLASFDVCQEPPPDVDDSDAPPPVTAVVLTRAHVEAVDWDEADLVDLLRLVRGDPTGRVVATPEVVITRAYREATSAASEA